MNQADGQIRCIHLLRTLLSNIYTITSYADHVRSSEFCKRTRLPYSGYLVKMGLKQRLQNNAEPGTRVFINIDNLIMKPIQVLRTIPDATPRNNGAKGSFVSKLFDHYQIDSLGEYTTWMTQPQNSMRGEQLIVYLAETQNLNIAESIINLVAKL